jgi:hypothetical protein
MKGHDMLKAMASPIPPHLLRVTVNTTFTPARLGSIVGWFAADFTLENTSEVEACHPFIAFSMLGLHFVKNEGWVQDYFDIRVAKRMLRFRSRQHSLGAGKCASPCSLRIPFTPEDGGSLRLLSGTERRVSEISDIRIFYVAGAANFAPERSSVVISANKIRSQVYEAFPWVREQQNRPASGKDFRTPAARHKSDNNEILAALSEWFPRAR